MTARTPCLILLCPRLANVGGKSACAARPSPAAGLPARRPRGLGGAAEAPRGLRHSMRPRNGGRRSPGRRAQVWIFKGRRAEDELYRSMVRRRAPAPAPRRACPRSARACARADTSAPCCSAHRARSACAPRLVQAWGGETTLTLSDGSRRAPQWERAMDEMLDRLVYKNEASGLTYVAEIRKRAPAPGPPARLALAASPHAHVQRGRLRPSVSVAPSAWLCRALWCKRAEAGCGSQALAVRPPIAAQTALLCARWPRGAPQGVGRPARAALDKRAPTARMLPHAGAARSATRWTTWRASSRRCWRWACARARWPATRRTSSWRSPRSWARHAGRCTRRRPPVRSRAGGALRARRACRAGRGDARALALCSAAGAGRRARFTHGMIGP